MMNTNGLPDDEHMMFETCRRHEEPNEIINSKECAFGWFKLHNCITMHGTKYIN